MLLLKTGIEDDEPKEIIQGRGCKCLTNQNTL